MLFYLFQLKMLYATQFEKKFEKLSFVSSLQKTMKKLPLFCIFNILVLCVSSFGGIEDGVFIYPMSGGDLLPVFPQPICGNDACGSPASGRRGNMRVVTAVEDPGFELSILFLRMSGEVLVETEDLSEFNHRSFDQLLRGYLERNKNSMSNAQKAWIMDVLIAGLKSTNCIIRDNAMEGLLIALSNNSFLTDEEKIVYAGTKDEIQWRLKLLKWCLELQLDVSQEHNFYLLWQIAASEKMDFEEVKWVWQSLGGVDLDQAE